jgi:hypothetical protein
VESNYSRPEKPARVRLPKYIERLYLLGALLLIAAGVFALYNSWRAHQLGAKTQESVNRIMKDLGEGSSDDK